jgi:signal transduction histidine kinase
MNPLIRVAFPATVRGALHRRGLALRPLVGWLAGMALLRQFAILSFVVIGVITVALSLVISYQFRKDLLEREWRTTADYVRTEALHFLTPEDFAAPMTALAQEHFRYFYQQTVMMPEIVRVKVYDATMTVVWSDESRLIGQRFPDNRELLNALGGRTRVTAEMELKGENVYEDNDAGALVELYVPIAFPGAPGVAGVVETYKLPEQVFTNIRRGQLVVAGTALGGGCVLYLSLFWIVRRASRRIECQRALTAHLQAAREEERSRVAHEIHDELAQGLMGLKMDLAWLATRPPDTETLRDKVRAMLTLADSTIGAARRIFTELRPPILDDLGLVAALEWQADDFRSRTGIDCRFTSSEDELVLDPEVAVALFRVCQEALVNLGRHARSSGVRIRLERQPDALVLAVEADGRGASDRRDGDRESLGWLAVRERVLLLGGSLVVADAPGRGTRATLSVPLASLPERIAV